MTDNKQIIFKSIGILTVLMTIAKALGLIREVAIASFYGVSTSTDAYFVAGGFVTNVFFAITAAISTVFLPHYILEKKQKSFTELSKDLSNIVSSLSVFAIIIIVLLYFFSPTIIHIIAPTYSGDIFADAVLYLRIYSVSILFSMLTNMLTSLLNAEGRYGFGACASIVYSVTSILFMVVLRKIIGVAALVVSIPISFFIQLIILYVNTKKYFKLKPSFNLLSPSLKRLLVLMMPVLLSNATVEINQLLTRAIASGLDQGAVSILSYANTLFNFVSTLIISTLITVYYTEFSESAKSHDEERFNKKITDGIILILIGILPVTIITWVYSRDIVKIAYGRGEFDMSSVISTANCLSIYSLAFLFDCVRNIMIKAFYAKDNMRTPLINSIISMCITVIGSYFFSKIWGVSGIVISICLSLVVAAVFLLMSGKQQICKYESKRLFTALWKSLLSACITTIALIVMDRVFFSFYSYIRFVMACVIGFGLYFALLILFRSQELTLAISLIRKKK